MTPGIMIVSLIFVGISMLVSLRLKSKFKEYSQVPLSSGLTGKEVAEKMLKDNGIYDVKVLSADGFLSDHYNPADKTVNLSPDVYSGASVAAAAVAAHECGHAVQHATSYTWLNFRSKMLPGGKNQLFAGSDCADRGYFVGTGVPESATGGHYTVRGNYPVCRSDAPGGV